MLRLAAMSVIGGIALFAMPPGVAPSSAAAVTLTEQSVGTSPSAPPPLVPASVEGNDNVRGLVDPAAPEPDSTTRGDEQDSTTTSGPDQEPSDAGPDREPTTTIEPAPPDEGTDQEPPVTTAPESSPSGEDSDQVTTTTPASVVPDGPSRPSTSPRVRDSGIPTGSIALAVFVLVSVGAVSVRLFRRRETPPGSGELALSETTSEERLGPADVAVEAAARDGTPIDASMSDFLVGLGEALMDTGAAVSHVESALRSVARTIGTNGIGVVVLPTAIIVSAPAGDDLITEIGAPGRVQLRFDQIDDVLNLVRDAETGAVDAIEGTRRLAEIRSAPPRYPPGLVLLGHVCASVGLAAILQAAWVEIVVAALLGTVVGVFRIWTGHRSASYRPFIILICASAVSASVFALTRVMGDLSTFPLLFSPLITFLPGGMLTIAVLELATGQIVSGASRLAAGGLQLLLMALGIVAGAQLVGVPAHELDSTVGGTVEAVTPWIGVAVLGIGLVWFYGARRSARVWILLVMFVAYAGQVVGGLFFGAALSAFFGALAMTPVAVLAARKSTAPSPLVTILPGFWLLLPGALGIDGVTRLFGAGGAAATGVLVTTVTSMVGVSLGILLGLLLVAKDPEYPWSETGGIEPPRSARRQNLPGGLSG